MSIKLINKVFADTTLDSSKKFIMLALADNANDEGFCYPSINTICLKTSLSKPTVIKNIRELEQKKYLISKKRNTKKNEKGGGRLSTIYIIFPNENIPLLDEDILSKFDLKVSQSKEGLPYSQSKEGLPQMGSQSKEGLPKPSPLFNHHLYKQLTKQEKDLFLEYLSLRVKMKIKNTDSIVDRLLKKYFDYGRNVEVIEKAIISNWKDFYVIKETSKANDEWR